MGFSDKFKLHGWLVKHIGYASARANDHCITVQTNGLTFSLELSNDKNKEGDYLDGFYQLTVKYWIMDADKGGKRIEEMRLYERCFLIFGNIRMSKATYEQII